MERWPKSDNSNSLHLLACTSTCNLNLYSPSHENCLVAPPSPTKGDKAVLFFTPQGRRAAAPRPVVSLHLITPGIFICLPLRLCAQTVAIWPFFIEEKRKTQLKGNMKYITRTGDSIFGNITYHAILCNTINLYIPLCYQVSQNASRAAGPHCKVITAFLFAFFSIS